MGRIDKENYYLDIAQTVAGRSTCLRRCYGAILVKSDEIISTGYNGAPRGRRNCVDLNYCTREALNIPSGERWMHWALQLPAVLHVHPALWTLLMC